MLLLISGLKGIICTLVEFCLFMLNHQSQSIYMKLGFLRLEQFLGTRNFSVFVLCCSEDCSASYGKKFVVFTVT